MYLWAVCLAFVKKKNYTFCKFYTTVGSFYIQVEQVLTVAEDLKNIGNTLFKNQDWKAAVKKYGKALR